MRDIIGFIKEYFNDLDKRVLAGSTAMIAVLIWLNYAHQLEPELTTGPWLLAGEFSGRIIIYTTAFLLPYIFLYFTRKKLSFPPAFLVTLLLAPWIFALKVTMDTNVQVADDPSWNLYWNEIVYWPLRLVAVLIILLIFYFSFHRSTSFYGLTTRNFKSKPYLWMLLAMLPLIAAASTQPDFLVTYPKLKQVMPLPDEAQPAWWYQLLFELSYGSDFFSIELFFRGFLVIGISRWAGKETILPMACFYCTIHFGKPLGECVSSYFGGLLLGIVSFHTRSIYGGLMVHLGIAWLMELGGYLGNLYKW